MNFFAHLVIARRVRREPAFLLGAMLPDFATMSGARLGPIAHGELAAGVAEHHATDEAFHAGRSFLALSGEAAARLEGAGLSWGAARAVGHVGTELFLDGELTDDDDAAGDYLRAIGAGGVVGEHVGFRGEDGLARFRDLHARLLEHGVPRRYREPAFVRDVLVRILARRPRLSVSPEHGEVLLDALFRLRGLVIERRGALVAETLEGLGRAR